MPRRGAAVLPIFQFGSRGGQTTKSLSEASLKRLKHVVKLVNQIDLAAANELHSCYQVEALSIERSRPQKLLASEQMQQFEGFSQKVTNRQSGVAAIETEDAIKTFLCDTECVSDWLLVSTAVSRIQNRYVILDGSIAVWDECRNRAEVFLDLGVSIIRYLEPIKVDLQEDAEDLVFAMRMKLNTIKAFHPIFQHLAPFQREHQDPIEPHLFVGLLDLFIQDDPLRTKVAEAYPETDTSLRAVLSATTLLVVVVCIVLIVQAWQRSPTLVGSRDDSNFYVALQTMLMQLLSLFTMMLPVSRFAPVVAWRLAWAFATVAAVCAVAAPVLFVTLPVGWSLLVSYMASTFQAVVVLQVMLNSNYFRRRTA